MPKVKRKKRAVVGGKRVNAPYASGATVVSDTTTITKDQTPPRAQDSHEVVARMLSSFRTTLTSHVATHPECKEYAPVISKYMRDPEKFVFLGLKAPARRALQKNFVRENLESLKERRTLVEFVKSLWGEEEREFQSFGVDLLIQQREILLGESEEEFQEAVGVAEHCIITKSWWDTVDALSYPVVGYFVRQRPSLGVPLYSFGDSILPGVLIYKCFTVVGYFVRQRFSLGVPLMWKWIDHDYMWLRRAAILHQLCQKAGTDADLLFGLCLRRADETEFFIRKAIGWALRDYAKTNSKAVKDFVEKNRLSLSALSIKEALKHC